MEGTTNAHRIRKALAEAGRPMTYAEIEAACGIDSVHNHTGRMVALGYLVRTGVGVLALGPNEPVRVDYDATGGSGKRFKQRISENALIALHQLAHPVEPGDEPRTAEWLADLLDVSLVVAHDALRELALNHYATSHGSRKLCGQTGVYRITNRGRRRAHVEARRGQ